MKEDFYTLKGVLDTVFKTLGINDVRYEEAGGELISSVYAGKELIGTMSLTGFELNFAKMAELGTNEVTYVAPSRYPSIIRDVSLFVPIETKVGDVEKVIENAMGKLARTLTLIDVFEKPEEKKKSLAFRMVLQSFEKTLSDEEANKVSSDVTFALESANPVWSVRK